MIVCAHGDVERYCSERGMVICEEHIGNIEDYAGTSRVIVTDVELGENEFYALKLKMLRKGVELVSVRHDNEEKDRFVRCIASEKREKRGGRRRFGEGSEAEMAVVDRILELRESGKTLTEISRDENVHRPDGRRLSISTVRLVIENYKKKG